MMSSYTPGGAGANMRPETVLMMQSVPIRAQVHHQPILKPQPGTYALILASTKTAPLLVGKLGNLKLQRGYYVYVGQRPRSRRSSRPASTSFGADRSSSLAR